MQVQVLLSMRQDRLSKEKSRELLYQWVHLIATTQELRHSTRNIFRLAGDYLVIDGTLLQEMET